MHLKFLFEIRETISAMAISLTSTFLLVGTSGGMIHLYDLPSHQLLRTISAHKGFSITYLTSLFKPLDLIGHISLDLKVGSLSDAKDALPAKPVQPFQKMKDTRAREAHEVQMLLNPKRNVKSNLAFTGQYGGLTTPLAVSRRRHRV